jgi:hypothetical protein
MYACECCDYTNLFVANTEECEAVVKYAQKYADDMDSSSKEDKVREHQLQMEVLKTEVVKSIASILVQKEITRQREIELEIVRSSKKS